MAISLHGSRAAGHTWPGAAQGFPAGLQRLGASVLTCQRDAAQDRTVYRLTSHMLPHANPRDSAGRMVFLSDRRAGGMDDEAQERLRNFARVTQLEPQVGSQPLTTGSRVLTAALPLCGFGWVSPAGACVLPGASSPFSSLTPGAIPPGHCPFLPLQAQEVASLLRLDLPSVK